LIYLIEIHLASPSVLHQLM